MLFFFHATATTEIYTLSLHDALPIYADTSVCPGENVTLLAEGADSYSWFGPNGFNSTENPAYIIDISMEDRKSTRLNSSHVRISYAVFCLKKKILIQEQSAVLS